MMRIQPIDLIVSVLLITGCEFLSPTEADGHSEYIGVFTGRIVVEDTVGRSYPDGTLLSYAAHLDSARRASIKREVVDGLIHSNCLINGFAGDSTTMAYTHSGMNGVGNPPEGWEIVFPRDSIGVFTHWMIIVDCSPESTVEP